MLPMSPPRATAAKAPAKAARTAPPGSLHGRLPPLIERLAELVDEQRASWRAADGLGHGLFIGEADVDLALAGLRALALSSDVDVSHRLDRVQDIFHLDEVEVGVLVAAVAPDLDQRFGLLYGYLQDDAARRSLSTDLALRITGTTAFDGAVRHRLSAEGSMARSRLLAVDTEDPDVLKRRLRVPERVTSHLLGVDTPPPEIAQAFEPLLGGIRPSPSLVTALTAGVPLIYLRGHHDASIAVNVAAAAEEADVEVVHLSLRGIAGGDLADWLALALREAALQGFVPLLGPVPDGLGRSTFGSLDLARVPVILHGPREWDVGLCAAAPVSIDVATLTEAEQAAVWQAGLDLAGVALDPGELARLRAGGAEVARSLRRATSAAQVLGEPLDAPLVAEQIRREHAPALERLAQRVVPSVRLSDVILPPASFDHVAGFLARIHNRDRLREELGVRSRGAKGRGITALFSGPSGTGKTLSAEAICGELGVDLYVVDLPSVLSKYIGETEQNLEQVFSAAEDIPGILFFDEADSMFGKRSDVSDARDRYANIEVSYLLQRLERFDGIVVLATNLRANLDDAFNRRLDAVVMFPAPVEDQRILLWEAHLPSDLPRAADLDLAFAAKQFELSGGTISSAAQSAAHEMLRHDLPLDNGMLARAIAAELDKAGRLVQPSDFGPWMEHLEGH
jgi:hypothetical protein